MLSMSGDPMLGHPELRLDNGVPPPKPRTLWERFRQWLNSVRISLIK